MMCSGCSDGFPLVFDKLDKLDRNGMYPIKSGFQSVESVQVLQIRLHNVSMILETCIRCILISCSSSITSIN
jgi:hypothetical protein